MIDWTQDQRRAIATVDRSLLVTAAAGSGKTAVLAERCAHLVTDATNPCRIDELLVVTFTEAAASEMRERIARALRDRQAARPSNARIRHQLALLDGAQISTIHAFCRNLLNRYFAQARIEPRMPMLDPLEAEQLRRQCAAETFDALSADDATAPGFLDFVSAYGASDRHLQSIVLALAAFLESHEDPAQWIADARERLQSTGGAGLPPYWLDLLVDSMTARFEMLRDLIVVIRERVRPCDGTNWFLPALDTVEAMADDALAALAGGDPEAAIDAIGRSLAEDTKWPRKPSSNSKLVKALSEADCEQLNISHDCCTQLKASVRGISHDFGHFTVADWAAGRWGYPAL